MDEGDAERLVRLEESLWRPGSRFDRARYDGLLADDFEEFGASGRRWTRAESLALPAEPFEAVLPLPDLRLRAVGPDAVLLTYRSEVRADGVVRVARRSSLWQRTDGAWRLRFHQGTPVPGA